MEHGVGHARRLLGAARLTATPDRRAAAPPRRPAPAPSRTPGRRSLGRSALVRPCASAASTSSRVMPSRYSTVSRNGTFTAVCAASRTTGLALKATPSPAAFSMSRSLAPSPIATVCASGTPASAANRRSSRALPARSTISPVDPAGELPVDDLQGVGRGEVQPEPLLQIVGDLGEAAGDDADLVAEPLQRTDQGAGARRQPHLGAHLVHHRRVEPRQQRHPRVQRLLEVQLAAHRRPPSPRRPSSSQPGVRGEELDHLVLDERRVDVHDDQPLRPAVQPGRDDRHVDAECRRPRWPARCAAPRSPTPDTANSTAVTGYLASRKIRSMLPPVVGDPGRDGGRRLRGQRVPEHGDVRTARAARPVVAECRR